MICKNLLFFLICFINADLAFSALYETPIKLKKRPYEAIDLAISTPDRRKILSDITNLPETPIGVKSSVHRRKLIDESATPLGKIAARMYRYLKEHGFTVDEFSENDAKEWIRKYTLIKNNSSRGREGESWIIEEFGGVYNNSLVVGSYHSYTSLLSPTAKLPARIVTTRPDAWGLDKDGKKVFVEVKTVTTRADEKTFYDSDQFRAQRKHCDRHIVVFLVKKWKSPSLAISEPLAAKSELRLVTADDGWVYRYDAIQQEWLIDDKDVSSDYY